MKLQIWFFFFLAAICAAAWLPEDYEIFSLNDKVKQDLGDLFDFYTWLGVTSKATTLEINKAYRKVSRQLHPDKVSGKNKKHAEERFQRLSLVGNILKDQSLRKRYDYFLAKGFPKWKGTGYFYSKFRPGLVFTLALLFVIATVFHYAAIAINRRQDFKRVQLLKEQLKKQAWGGSILPPADGSDRKIVNEQTGKLFIIAADGNVYLDDSDELHLLDENVVSVTPHFKESLLYKFPCSLWNVTGGKLTGKIIDTTYVPPASPSSSSSPAPQAQKQKKKPQRGDKIELPNGKVIYGRKRK